MNLAHYQDGEQELEALELEVSAASEVEEADEVQHTMALEQVQLDDTCYEESRYGASGKMSPKMSLLHGCA